MFLYKTRASVCAVLLAFLTSSISASDFNKIESWKTENDGTATINLSLSDGLLIDYDLKSGFWVQMYTQEVSDFKDDIPLVFNIKADSPSFLEVKFEDDKGNSFLRKIPLKDKYKNSEKIVIFLQNLTYGWGGDGKYSGKLNKIYFAVSGNGKGKIWLNDIGFGKSNLKPSFSFAGPQLDPNRLKTGNGTKQRMSKKVIPEDKLVLEWLKQMQDNSSPEKALLPSMEDNIAHTFNNALCAIAFTLCGEKERAERILNFYSKSANPENEDIKLQDFFYKGEPRGFYQSVFLKGTASTNAYHEAGTSDRWIGDMAWLLIAYKYYDQKFDAGKYTSIEQHLKNLLTSFYTDAQVGGYIRHGYRQSDAQLHAPNGHPEGNIDCYAALKLCGETFYTDKIKLWLDSELKGDSLPLDLYTWRVLAFGQEYAELLNIPEYDFRYRKTIKYNKKDVVGLFDRPDIEVNNIWLDGTGHIACAFYSIGNDKRGNFYANQLDPFIFEKDIKGNKAHCFPYTANKDGGYEWVDLTKGAVSPAVWYIFAKNRFNPFTLKIH